MLGNGRSRLQANLDKLKKYGKVYGCNALYRDFIPDYLVAVDSKMVIEINAANVQDRTEVWTNPNRNFKNFSKLNFFEPAKGWSSGPTALWLASTHNYNTIFILGFDYKGLQDRYLNNVYADTPNYRKSKDPATFYGNWSRQTEQVIQSFPDINYVRVDNDPLEFSWKSLKNYSTIDYKTFENRLNDQN